MSFTAVTAYVSPARNGEPMYYSTLSTVELRQPDKLRVVTPGDGPRRILNFGELPSVMLRRGAGH